MTELKLYRNLCYAILNSIVGRNEHFMFVITPLHLSLVHDMFLRNRDGYAFNWTIDCINKYVALYSWYVAQGFCNIMYISSSIDFATLYTYRVPYFSVQTALLSHFFFCERREMVPHNFFLKTSRFSDIISIHSQIFLVEQFIKVFWFRNITRQIKTSAGDGCVKHVVSSRKEALLIQRNIFLLF